VDINVKHKRKQKNIGKKEISNMGIGGGGKNKKEGKKKKEGS